jgi:hypothetical protein
MFNDDNGAIQWDGGLLWVSRVHYGHLECAFFKIDLEFDYTAKAAG